MKGFGGMPLEKRRAIARKGGKAAHAQNRAHTFTKDEARAAGSKGGQATAKNREHMQEIGRKGGRARHARKKTPPKEEEE